MSKLSAVSKYTVTVYLKVTIEDDTVYFKDKDITSEIKKDIFEKIKKGIKSGNTAWIELEVGLDVHKNEQSGSWSTSKLNNNIKYDGADISNILKISEIKKDLQDQASKKFKEYAKSR